MVIIEMRIGSHMTTFFEENRAQARWNSSIPGLTTGGPGERKHLLCEGIFPNCIKVTKMTLHVQGH